MTKIDIDNLWWNVERIDVRELLLWHFRHDGHTGLLTGCKGCGKTTLSKYLAKELPQVKIVDEVQKLEFDERQQMFKDYPQILMVSVNFLVDDGYGVIGTLGPLSNEEVFSYINYKKESHIFTESAIVEIATASKGGMRLINLLCRLAIEKYGSGIDAKMIENITRRRLKLRY